MCLTTSSVILILELDCVATGDKHRLTRNILNKGSAIILMNSLFCQILMHVVNWTGADLSESGAIEIDSKESFR